MLLVKMETFRKGIGYFIILISTLVILASLLSLIYDVSYWLTKVLDFPRLQYLIAATVCLLAFIPLNRKWRWPSVSLVSGLVAAIVIQCLFVLPYLIGEKKVADSPQQVDEQNTVSILISNVLIKNRSAEGLLTLVNKYEPDMLLVMEVNEWWMNQLASLEKHYAHIMKHPTDNAYGMALYSKLPLKDSQIEFFQHKDVPSFHVQVVLPSGKTFRFHGMHPVAPVRSEKYPDNKGKKEVALLKVGTMVAQDPLPAIVAGDFNDVSWSNTSRLFESRGELNNVRLGRGLYNSFDATSHFMRWPLDHYFVSDEFSLVRLERLPEIGSDHFPMFAEFMLR